MTALRLISRVDEAYRIGYPRDRRLCNQTFFEKLLIGKDGSVVGALIREPFATWLTEEFVEEMAQTARNPGAISLRRGSNVDSLVGPASVKLTVIADT